MWHNPMMEGLDGTPRWQVLLLLLIFVAACGDSGPTTTPSPGSRPEQHSEPKSSITGRIVSIADGDTARLLTPDKRQVKIRLVHIDAPEKAQAYGKRSRQTLAAYIFKKDVTVKVFGTDKYKRTLGEIFVGDKSINLAMVRDGMAWHYKKYSQHENYAQAESQARAAKRGLWADEKPMAPWDWRRGGKKQQRPKHPGSGKYWINAGSNSRHNAKCEWFGRTSKGYYTDDRTVGKPCGGCGG